MMEKHWIIPPRLPLEAEQVLGEFPPVLRQILYNRGFASSEAALQYIEARTPPNTNPYNLSGIQPAVDRIQLAIQNEEKIAIYGDYDVDGVTATVLLMQVLQRMDADVQGYIPNRFDEGYGLNIEALNTLNSAGISLVITVDCGIRSFAEAEHAFELGMDLIISDHHHPSPQIPRAIAIINPKLPNDGYPEKELAGVGLAYKLACALLGEEACGEWQDLVALGTVADMAPLTGENRALVRAGLNYLRSPHRPGIQALIAVAGLRADRIDASAIGFMLAPRINAAGRLDTALAALELLTTKDIATAANIAQQLEIFNHERQELTREIQSVAEAITIGEEPDAILLFAAHPDFNSGVIGLAASRLCEQYYRPTVIASLGEDFSRASCRSIPEFHITQALDECSDLLEHHGGHAAAAGFTIRNENLPRLKERLMSLAKIQLSSVELRPVLYADIELPLVELKPEILKYLEWLQPTGYGNRSVHFISRNLKVIRSQTVGREKTHLKMSLTDGQIIYDAIAFRQGHWGNRLPASVDILYSFETNEFNGRITLQLNVHDIKPSSL